MTRVLGIRHHGPGSARAVAEELPRIEPDLVLIEGPPEADPLVELVADKEMDPPVALLAYAADDATRAAFWPFAVFSPEWQAISYALRAEVPVRFCDLPAAIQFATAGDERSGLAMDPLAKLAEAGGYDDPERWWDDVIEHRRDGAPPFDAIAEAMSVLREEFPADVTRERQREAYMRTALRKARRDGFERIAVVCGAWHVPALTDPLPPAAHDQRVLKGLPKRKVACTWVPWTHGRLATASGYGAGVTSPGWYHHLFSSTDRITVRWLTEVARVLRAEDLPVSSAHVIESVRLAETLAALRDRPLVGLAEVTEATWSVLCGGNDVLLDLVTRRLVVGERLGSVPERTPQAPVAADLAAQARRLRLRREPDEREVDLDLRNAIGAERSQLLHRLRTLDVHWGRPTVSARRNTGTFRESWMVRWHPEFEVDLVAASAHGTTVAAAATAVVRRRALDATVLTETTAAVEDCLLAGLLDALPEALSALDTRSARDADVASLMAALPALARAARYGDVRGTDTASLRAVAERMLARIRSGLPPAVRGLDDDAAAEMCQLIDDVHEVSTLLGQDASERWLAALSGLVARDDLAPLLSGRVTRILGDASRMPVPEVAARLSRALTPGVEPARGAAYIEGFFAGGALLLVHDDRLLRVIDQWLTGIPDGTFTEVLPLLRRTFGAFAGPERRAIGERAKALTIHSGHIVEHAEEVDRERAEAALPVIARLLGVGAGG
ncbi:MAG TPA: DUF5682 family protein [Actinophytocola sp.]|uniref:DUF5682 family protein n=1 Tax=Actinophytocola sp. TaxID=1872138 RepID=UPI002DBAE105|nr:DUF5682 family protein [Actinophytocola sp.]HEU5471426.1 DUF5682 family protein [Actinophytocola sp.]